MSEHYRLSIVLPAHNEEKNVGEAIQQAVNTANRLCSDYEIIVIDDGSTDSTADVVRQAAAENDHVKLVSHGTNRGYGETLRTGFRHASKDLVFFTDADLQFDIDELEAFLPWSDRVDVVAGYRIERRDRWTRRVSARFWNYLVRVLFYVPVRDIDCAFKLFRRSALLDLDLQSLGAMVNTELMVKLGRSGFSVVEVGVSHYKRRAGRARGASPKVVLRAFRELWRIRHRLREQGAGTARTLSPRSHV